AIEDDEYAVWTCHNGEDVLHILVVTNSHSQAGSRVASHSTSVHSTMATWSETPGDPGLNFFKKEILIQLGVSPDLSDRSDGSLCQAYEKYKAYLQAYKTYGEMMSNKSWVGDKLMGADIIQLFILKSFFHSHYKKLFSKVSNYLDLVDWLEGDPGAPSDEDLWG
ncbi:hypothetical protein L208DRAFT_1213958, partial [Tricholoma matsutake]